MNRTRCITFLGLIAALMGSSADAQTNALPAEIRVADETIPPGGTVQLKFSLTEPRPIMIGTTAFALDTFAIDALFGVSLFSPAGDVFGVAQYQNGQFKVNYISALGTYGTFVDYPILTVTAHVRPDAAAGSQSFLSLGPGSVYNNLLGQTFPFVEAKPGILTIGGSVAIHNVVPGGGVWPAGTTVKILGMGFSAQTKLQTKFKTRSVQFVNSNEIDVVLDRNTRMDSQPIQVSNPDGSKHTYFSYLRGTDLAAGSNALIAAAEPVFPVISLQRATIGQAPRGLNGTIETALAIQNSNSAPVTVVLTASTAMSQVAQKTITLSFGEKITRELGEYFGTQLAAGTIVRIAASAPVQLVPFYADRATAALTPFIPLPF